MTKSEEYANGEVFYAYVRFRDVDGDIGKERPIVALKDPETESWQALKITSRLDKKINHKYGYLLEDWKSSGLHLPSIIKCNLEDIEEIEPVNIKKKIGELSQRDMKGLLVKLIKVRQLELSRERQRQHGFDYN